MRRCDRRQSLVLRWGGGRCYAWACAGVFGAHLAILPTAGGIFCHNLGLILLHFFVQPALWQAPEKEYHHGQCPD